MRHFVSVRGFAVSTVGGCLLPEIPMRFIWTCSIWKITKLDWFLTIRVYAAINR